MYEAGTSDLELDGEEEEEDAEFDAANEENIFDETGECKTKSCVYVLLFTYSFWVTLFFRVSRHYFDFICSIF